jgi:hypothetical protein
LPIDDQTIWDSHTLRKQLEREEKRRQPKKPRRFARTAEEMHLAHEIRYALSRRGSHPREWVRITAENELHNLRASDFELWELWDTPKNIENST